MNLYQFLADMCHLFAILFLLYRILKTKSCAGISGKTQLLLLIVFLTRYLDLFSCFINYYLTAMKLVFIGLTALTVLLIFVIYKPTYDSEHDTFRMAYLLIPAAVLAFYINHEFYFLEIMWTLSIYLEAVAIVPQIIMIRKVGQMEMFLIHYLFALGFYRGLYICNWVYRYSCEGFFDSIAFWSGCVQTALYCYFLFTTDFLKKLAHSYHQLHNAKKGYAELEKDAEQIVVVVGLEGQVEDKEHLSVHQLNSISVPSQEDTNMDGLTQQPQVSTNDTAQLDMAGSSQEGDPGAHNNLSAAATGVPSLGEEAKSSSVEFQQPQPQ